MDKFWTTHIFININNLEIDNCPIWEHIWKRWAPNNHKNIRVNKFKSWIWDQYLSKNMKSKFGKMLKPRNHTTIKT